MFIYVATPDGTLSAGEYYLWPLLHQTATRIDAEVSEMRLKNEGRWRWDYYRGSMRKWLKRMPQLHNLIRIRKATIQALCTWDLDGRRPKDLVVLNTDRNLTGIMRQDALEMVNAHKGSLTDGGTNSSSPSVNWLQENTIFSCTSTIPRSYAPP